MGQCAQRREGGGRVLCNIHDGEVQSTLLGWKFTPTDFFGQQWISHIFWGVYRYTSPCQILSASLNTSVGFFWCNISSSCIFWVSYRKLCQTPLSCILQVSPTPQLGLCYGFISTWSLLIFTLPFVRSFF